MYEDWLEREGFLINPNCCVCKHPVDEHIKLPADKYLNRPEGLNCCVVRNCHCGALLIEKIEMRQKK